MPKYRTVHVPRSESTSDDHWYSDGYEAPQTIDVHQPEHAWQPTGLLDAGGNELQRFVGIRPIGFLADIDE
jgi:hypothetical protein